MHQREGALHACSQLHAHLRQAAHQAQLQSTGLLAHDEEGVQRVWLCYISIAKQQAWQGIRAVVQGVRGEEHSRWMDPAR